MIDPTGHIAQVLSDAINPALVALGVASVAGRRSFDFRYLLRNSAAIAAAVCLTEASKHYQFWPGHPAFPSGHETLAAGCATALVLRDRRWAVAAAPLAAIMGWSLIRAHHHDLTEVLVGALNGFAFVAAANALAKRLSDDPRPQARRETPGVTETAT